MRESAGRGGAHTYTHIQAAVCEDRGQERFSHSNLLALPHSLPLFLLSLLSLQFLPLTHDSECFCSFFPASESPPCTPLTTPPPHTESNLLFIWKCCSLSPSLPPHTLTCTHIHTTLYTQSPAIGRGRERQRESKQARGRHLSSLLRALQVPKMAENKQEPRQLKKPGHKDGQTDSEGVRV